MDEVSPERLKPRWSRFLTRRVTLRSLLPDVARRWLRRVLLGLVVVLVLLVVAVWAGLRFFIVPRIDSLRPLLEVQATQALGQPLRIGAIRAETGGGLLPTFVLQDVVLYERPDVQEQPVSQAALHLPLVRVVLSLPALFHLGFEQLVVEQPDLVVRRAADGRFFVAGVEIKPQQNKSDGRVVDWLLAQTEWRIEGGTVHWIDETRDVPPLDLKALDFSLKNGWRTHEWRLDAQGPEALGGHIALRGDFREPLLAGRASDWQRWNGQLYAELQRVDMDALRRYIVWPPVQIQQKIKSTGGSGAMRTWVNVEDGRIRNVTTEVAMRQLTVQLGPDLPALSLNHLAGRFGLNLLDGGFEIYSEGLRFDTRDGLAWPGGDARVSQTTDSKGRVKGGLSVSNVDLAVLADFARHLPLPAKVHQTLLDYAPKGRIETLQASWRNQKSADGSDTGMPKNYQAQGRLAGLSVAAQEARGEGQKATPGFAGVTVDFNLNQNGGGADVQVQHGYLDWPGLFEPARIAFDPLAVGVRWKLQGGAVKSVQIASVKIANADLQGELKGEWKDDKTIDLQGSFSRIDLTALPRYFPTTVPAKARDYLRDALLQGRATQVKLRLRGDMRQFPFNDPKTGKNSGEFRLTAKLQGARFAYVPPSLQPAGQAPWPVLDDLEGDFVLEGSSLQLNGFTASIRNAQGGIAPGLRLTQSKVTIPDWSGKSEKGGTGGLRVQPELNFSGPLDSLLHQVAALPLQALQDGPLAKASATGDMALQLKLDLPLSDLKASTAQGQLLFGGNTLQAAPGLPAVTQTRGTVYFSEKGFALSGVSAQVLGGEVQAEGGTMRAPGALTLRRSVSSLLSTLSPSPEETSAAPRLHVQGQFTALALRQAGQLKDAPAAVRSLAALARQMDGGASYEAEFAMNNGRPEFWLRSDLRGLALGLPAPLSKPADVPLPLRAQLEPLPQQQDRLSLDVGRLINVRYERAHDANTKTTHVLRGAIEVNLEPRSVTAAQAQRGLAIALPDSGVRANVQLGELDLNAWREVATPPDAGEEPAAPRQQEKEKKASVPAQGQLPAWLGYVPTQLRVQGEQIKVGSQSLHQLDLNAQREPGEQNGWHARVTAQELDGEVDYRMAGKTTDDASGAAFLRAHFSRLVLNQPASSAKTTEDKPEEAGGPTAPVARSLSEPDDEAANSTLTALSLPALDVVIDQLELGNKHLGRVEIEATHVPLPLPQAGAGVTGTTKWAWQLKRVRVSLPEAEFTAQGQWPAPPPQTAPEAASQAPAASASAPESEEQTWFQAPGGTVPAASSAQPQQRSTVEFRLDVKDAGALLANLGFAGQLSGGEGWMRGQLSWPGVPWKPSIATLDGSLRLRVERGQILKVKLGAINLLGVLSLQSLPRRLLGNFSDAVADGFAFDFARGTVKLERGVASTNNLQIKGVLAAVLMSGEADLVNESQDLRVVIVPEINAGTASLIVAVINPVVGLATFLAQAIARNPAIEAATQEFHVTGTWKAPKMEKVQR